MIKTVCAKFRKQNHQNINNTFLCFYLLGDDFFVFVTKCTFLHITLYSRVAAASPSSRPPSSGAAFLLAKANGDSYTAESLKSGGVAFLVLLEAAPARAAA